MRSVAIIQARTGSSRLPGKVLMKVCGLSVLAHVINRTLEAPGLAEVVVATTTLAADEPIVLEAEACGVRCSRGSVEDVLSRYWEAAKLFDADVVIRVTSDNPLVDPELIGQMLGEFEGWSGGNLDYLSNNLERSFPYGLDIEVFPVRSLERAHGDARDRFEREHVTPYLRRHPELFALANFKRKGEDLSWLRWTLDTLDDFEFISAVYEALWQGKSYFSTQSVLDLLSSRPELVRVNS